MAKALQSTSRLQEFARIISSEKVPRPKHSKPSFAKRVATPVTPKPAPLKVGPDPAKRKMESSEGQLTRIPLAQVVSDCVKRWFLDTLKEAKAGDRSMQILVAQMYNSGYGVPQDLRKGRAWTERASRHPHALLTVADKHPGYNASDSDTDLLKAEFKQGYM
ncbi:Sel1-like [Quillaja saponaria]|uniref:Sel1-like n=1 Tax=Quillaja saponaria TaxID=32244 RepID=A0AAD7LTP7_QUISA|nr:Sel1-like [Quillaja saponaria]